jgi:hypothetical protein
MRFREAVEDTAAIRGQYREGLQGVRNVDRSRLSCATPRRLCGSVDLDGALRLVHPNDPRWDYAIGVSEGVQNDTVIWVEVHPASSCHVEEVLRKLQWLKDWLRYDAPAMGRLPRHFRWIATGTVSFRRGSREEKKIAQRGLRFPVKQLDLDSFR